MARFGLIVLAALVASCLAAPGKHKQVRSAHYDGGLGGYGGGGGGGAFGGGGYGGQGGHGGHGSQGLGPVGIPLGLGQSFSKSSATASSSSGGGVLG